MPLPKGVTPVKGQNYFPPRLEICRQKNRTPRPRWAVWCGWCKKDHRYSARLYSQEQAAAMHTDHITHICKEKALGHDPFG